MNSVSKSKIQKSNKSIENNHKKKDLEYPERLIDSKVVAASNILQLDIQVLCEWLKSQCYVSSQAKYTLLRAIIEYELNPLNEEIILIESNHQDQSAWPFITVDGWIKLINKHPQFCGIEFTSPSEEERHPEWMECSIYRHDRIKPITIREYLVEVVTDQALWKDRPNRMLRYRAMAQCAKLAFGICVPDYPLVAKNKSQSNKSSKIEVKLNLANPDRISLIKEILNDGGDSTQIKTPIELYKKRKGN